jgi:hypothetical protein
MPGASSNDEYRRIAAQFEVAKRAKLEANGKSPLSKKSKASQKEPEAQFTMKHGLLIAWFTIIMYASVKPTG